ncbi:glutathione peroxidase [uncultured Draconibacterium sp.]|uniref:glutathione peroxidase n=1 Tax=uncultured Draconibacterium sp. TaxID=1573823 RepID=UPI0025F86F5B|nr:glutathione peroxidase [uncultured Draconibacterium sp.]
MKRLLFMKTCIFLIFFFCITSVTAQNKTLHNFSALTLDGDTLHFSSFAGKKLLLVNTASECMFTPQYTKLQKLYEEYGRNNFEVIAFPCNDFGKQEPGNNQKIKEFCAQYNVSFTVMAKISIKGEAIHPVYRWLTLRTENGVLDAKVRWNFQKFLVDENGKLVNSFGPSVSPLNPKIIEWITD